MPTEIEIQKVAELRKQLEEDGRFVSKPPPSDPVLSNADRITAQFHCHHEHLGSPPVSCGGNFASMLETCEQPYVRRVKLGENWEPLDTGWLARKPVSLICLRNVTRISSPHQVPSQEDLKDLSERVILLKCGPGVSEWQIKPGRFFVAEPAEMKLAAINVRSAFVSSDLEITIFPG
jgi:hypothetical protein